MPRTFANTSADHLDNTSAFFTAYPFTIMAWVYVIATHSGTTVFRVDDGTANNTFDMGFDATAHVAGQAKAAGSADFVVTTATFSLNTWNHMAYVGTSATSRAVFLNGVNKVTTAVSKTPTGINRTRVGIDGGTTSNMDGDIGELAVYNIDLTDFEIVQAARGIHPFRIRPISCLAYNHLWGIGSPEPDFSLHGRDLTVTGTTRSVRFTPSQPFWNGN